MVSKEEETIMVALMYNLFKTDCLNAKGMDLFIRMADHYLKVDMRMESDIAGNDVRPQGSAGSSPVSTAVVQAGVARRL